jgi:hypothetical protein
MFFICQIDNIFTSSKTHIPLIRNLNFPLMFRSRSIKGSWTPTCPALPGPPDPWPTASLKN